MQGGYFSYVLLCALAIALLVAAFTDLRSRRIHNWLNAGIALAAPLYWFASGMGPYEIGIQLAVAAGVFVVLAILFAIRAMGGGDVKLLTALALWIKPIWFLELIVVMAIVGGLITIAFGCWHVARRNKDRLAVPYGVAIAFAGLWTLVDNYLPAMGGGGNFG